MEHWTESQCLQLGSVYLKLLLHTVQVYRSLQMVIECVVFISNTSLFTLGTGGGLGATSLLIRSGRYIAIVVSLFCICFSLVTSSI